MYHKIVSASPGTLCGKCRYPAYHVHRHLTLFVILRKIAKVMELPVCHNNSEGKKEVKLLDGKRLSLVYH